MSKLASLGRVAALSAVAAFTLTVAGPALAYDGTKCKEPGVCWEPKPGFPEKAKITGSKYDPKHDPKQVARQSESIAQMEERNKKRSDNFVKTKKFVYDVSKIAN